MNKFTLLPLFLMAFLMSFSQRPSGAGQERITISGTVFDKDTGQPLEYATLVLQSVRRPEMVTGGISDSNGKFSVETMPGQYNVSVEYLSYKSFKMEAQTYRSSVDLGRIELEIDAQQLEDVVVVREGNATLVVHKNSTQDIKKALKLLQEKPDSQQFL